MMDEDGNGSLDRYELEMGLADIGGIPQHEIDGLFFALDNRDDGQVSALNALIDIWNPLHYLYRTNFSHFALC